ncbi:hypothetical protein RB653_005583 [Dictyostelium firmibasis]|uniref:Uncharacterized protein n=1 Tax=Dictyostelium firmibasis TaxID=79012 RepID=A0AAN7U7W6_9MYCE
MVRQTKIIPIHSIGHNFSGFDKSYPEELYSSLPIIEYTQTIEYINSKLQRDYKSYLLYMIIFAVFGLVPFFIALSVELFRSSLYKNRFERDFDNCLKQVNELIKHRNVVFSFKFTTRIRNMKMLELIITYPDQTNIEIVGNFIVSPEGRNILVLPPPLLSSPLNFDQVQLTTSKKSNKNKVNDKTPILNNNNNNNVNNSIYCTTKVRYKHTERKSNGLKDDSFYGFQDSNYDKSLYNFMLENEYQSMIREFNTVLIRKIEIKKQLIFLLVSTILLIALIGFLLIIPASILYYKKRANYYTHLYNDLNIMVHKYSSIYNSRGITISYSFENSDDFNNDSSPLINLLIIYPKAPHGSPILTNFINNPHQWILAPSSPNAIAPYFTTLNNMIYINNNNNNNNDNNNNSNNNNNNQEQPYQTEQSLNYLI